MVFYYQLSEWVLLTGKTNYCVSIYLSFTVSVRGCRPEVFIYQAIPNFVTFTEKHQRWSSFYMNLEFRIDGTPRLLIIPFFVTLPNLNQFWRILPAAPFISDSPFINSWAQSAGVA